MPWTGSRDDLDRVRLKRVMLGPLFMLIIDEKTVQEIMELLQDYQEQHRSANWPLAFGSRVGPIH